MTFPICSEISATSCACKHGDLNYEDMAQLLQIVQLIGMALVDFLVQSCHEIAGETCLYCSIVNTSPVKVMSWNAKDSIFKIQKTFFE